MLVFLDFDGVLHPDEVYLHGKQVELRSNGQLFMWAPELITAIDGLDVQIVLSTSWVRHLGFRKARKALPEALSRLVIGATWHSAMRLKEAGPQFLWDLQTRYEQIQTYLDRLPSTPRWCAIDDDVRGWPSGKRSHLIDTAPGLGLSCVQAQGALRERLLQG